MNLAPFLAVACVLSACRATELRAKEPDTPLTYHYGGKTVSHDEIEITLARSECFGECPVYTVTVYGSGQVEFHGEKYTNTTGEKDWNIPPSTVQLLLDYLEGVPFAEYTNTVDQVSDVPSVTFTLRIGSQRLSLENRWAAIVGDDSPTVRTVVHAQLDDLAYFIDVCAGTRPFVRTR